MPTVTEVRRRLRGIGGHVAVAIWEEEDVLNRAEELGIACSQKQAREIIDTIDRKQDCSCGITWDSIDFWLYELKDGRL